MDIADFIDLVQKGGITALVLMILIGGAKEWWVYGVTYRRLLRDRDEWRSIALSSTTMAEKSLDARSKP